MKSLHKIPKFHLISWCGNFVKTHSFRCPKLCRNCAFPQNLNTRKLYEIFVFYVVNEMLY